MSKHGTILSSSHDHETAPISANHSGVGCSQLAVRVHVVKTVLKEDQRGLIDLICLEGVGTETRRGPRARR